MSHSPDIDRAFFSLDEDRMGASLDVIIDNGKLDPNDAQLFFSEDIVWVFPPSTDMFDLLDWSICLATFRLVLVPGTYRACKSLVDIFAIEHMRPNGGSLEEIERILLGHFV